MEYQVSQPAVAFVAHWEGYHEHLYNDPGSNATIGFGHLVHQGPVNGTEEAKWRKGISREDALALLRADLGNAESHVNRLVDVPLTQNQFDALVSFVFNVGVGNFTTSALLTRLNNKEYDAVPYELSRWTRSGGQRFAGLVRRREQEAEVWSNGEYDPDHGLTADEIKKRKEREAAVSVSTPQVPKGPITTSIPWVSQLDIYTDSNSYSYDCLAAVVCMILRHFGVRGTNGLITIDEVVAIWGKPKATDAGYHILAPVNESPTTWPVRFSHRADTSWAQVAAETAQNRPVIAYIQADLLPYNWRYHGYRGDHFVLITGIKGEQVHYLDPNWETEAQGRCWLPKSLFEPAWAANRHQVLFMQVKG